MHRRKMLFYCQYLTGLGHLVRSTELAREFTQWFDVHFINGGPELDGFAPPAGVILQRLPALWLEGGEYRISEQCESVSAVKAARVRQLTELVQRVKPDCVVTEFFPFGRHKLLFELEPFMQTIREVVPQCKVVCSVRDIIGRTSVSSETQIIRQLVNQYYDLILHHSDPSFLDFSSAYHDHAQLKCPAISTGFVARSCDASSGRQLLPGRPYIVASVGGGRLGFDLLRATLLAYQISPAAKGYDVVLLTGPFMPDAQVEELQELAKDKSQIFIKKFVPNLGDWMASAALSISLAGYNTTMDVLRSGVPAIVVPYGHYDQDQEQLQRTDRLAEQGVLETIDPAMLSAEVLADKMSSLLERNSVGKPSAELGRDRAPVRYCLDGARRSAELLREMFREDATSVATKSSSEEVSSW
jgi:predicted glycosyltransferase